MLGCIKTFVLLSPAALVRAHPCDGEVAAACPDRPASDIAACLKDPSEHETVTKLSSECTDFVALNIACAEDMETHCDEVLFSDEVATCLTQNVEEGQHSETCQNVMKWALPGQGGGDEEEQQADETVTDELGLSEKDYAEKKEWQAKRKAGRGDAIERMKLKEQDAKNEEDRVELEKFKREDPEGYASMIQQQEEEKRQQQEMKRRERQLAAAFEQRKRASEGKSEDDDAPKKSKKKKSQSQQMPAQGPPAQYSKTTGLACLSLVAAACIGGYFVMQNVVDSNAKPEKKRKAKRA